ncbi:hypothetical protein [Dactylosporangium sp. NPDC049140]|uniref:hypothetical protein n=1 Tax=Dactylosporangium sp. NPDC049140 TaxID=3155647 RepID=UPI0033DC9810
MFPAYCSALGLTGWLLMLGLWVAVVALVVWGVTRLFPDRRRTGPPPSPAADERSHQPVSRPAR